MKKKILITALLTLVFALLLVIGVCAAGQSYTTFDVTLTDGTTKTAYSAGTDQWEGRIYLNAKLYAEAPVDNEGTYEEIDWSTVKVLDFSNAMIYLLNSDKVTHTEKAYGSNQGNTALCLQTNGIDRTKCTNLEKVITGKLVTVRGTSLGKLPALKEVVISKAVKELQYNSFERNPLLETVIFEEGSALTTIGQQSFIECPKLVSIELPNTVSSMAGSVFQGCTSLKSVNWPTSLTQIPGSTFNGCKAMESFEIPSWVTEIGSSAFNGCTSFTSVYIPANITKIGSDCWRGCSGVTSVEFHPDCSVTHIYAHTFDGTKITEITLPNTVTSIGQNAFASSTLAVINLGASFNNFNANNAGQAPLSGRNIEYLYLSNTFTANELRNNIFNWTDTDNEGDLKIICPKLVVFYTGTKEQAEAISQKAKTGNNGAALNGFFASMVLLSTEEYEAAVKNGTLVEGVSGTPARYMVYGYNKCEAFYDGEHKLSEDATQKFENEAYTSRYISVCACTRGCGSDAVTELCAPLFVNKGYSKEIGGTFFDYGFVANKEAIALYEQITGEKLSYGIIAANKSISQDGALIDENGNAIDGAIAMSFDGTSYDTYSVKITGISEEYKASELYCCAYIYEADDVSYIGDKVTELASLISYDKITPAEE